MNGVEFRARLHQLIHAKYKRQLTPMEQVILTEDMLEAIKSRVTVLMEYHTSITPRLLVAHH